MIDQYCRFCMIGKEERDKGGKPADIASRIVERCMSEDVLFDLFSKHGNELEGEMRECMSQEIRFKEYLWQQNLESEVRGRTEQAITTIKNLLLMGTPFDDAVRASALPKEELAEVLEAFPEFAEAYLLKEG